MQNQKILGLQKVDLWGYAGGKNQVDSSRKKKKKECDKNVLFY